MRALALACALCLFVPRAFAAESTELHLVHSNKPRRGLLIGGAVTFGLGYLPSVAIGAASLRYGYPPGAFMFIPVAGPFVQLAVEKDNRLHPLEKDVLLLLGGAQVVGAALLVSAFAFGVADGPSVALGDHALQIGVGAPGAPLGVTLSLSER